MTEPALPPNATLQVGKKTLSVAQARAVMHSAAGWFSWIAALSVLNSLAAMAHQQYRMALGLGYTELVDVFTYYNADATPKASSPAQHAVALVLVGVIAGGVYLLGRKARSGSSAAFLAGLIIYGIDSLVFLALNDWLGVALHGFALFMIWGGYGISKKLHALALNPPAPPPLPAAEPQASAPEVVTLDTGAPRDDNA